MSSPMPPDFWQRVEELRPLVRALDHLREAVDISTENWASQLPDLDDRIQDTDHDERVRDLAIDTESRLFCQASDLAREYGLKIVFNRVEARFALKEINT